MRASTTTRLGSADSHRVSNWLGSGRFQESLAAESSHRHVPLHYLITFLKEHQVLLNTTGGKIIRKVLVVSDDRHLIAGLQRSFEAVGGFEPRAVGGESDVEMQAERLSLDGILVDFAIGRSKAERICRRLRRHGALPRRVLVAILPEGSNRVDINRLGLDDVFRRPFDEALLVERLRSLLARRISRV